MRLLICIAITMLFVCQTTAQDIWKTDTSSTVSFFSDAPLEDIFVESNTFSGAINTKTNAVAVFIKINTLQFDNKMQQEHFNEKYMESDLYPKAIFKGKISGIRDWTTPGTYKATAKGTLDIHGVVKEREIPVTITITDSDISATSTFMVKVADHDVEVPEIVFNKVAEEVEIKVNANFIPHE